MEMSLSDREIAKRVRKSKTTVRNHVKAYLNKNGEERRVRNSSLYPSKKR